MNGHPQFDEDFDLYALGALEGEEKQALESHVETCPECARKTAEARGRLAVLTLASPLESPSPRVKERLLARVRAEATGRRFPRFLALRGWATAGFALASLLLAAALVLLTIQNRSLSHRVSELQNAFERQTAQASRARAVLDVLTAPETVKVTLVAEKARRVPQGKAFYHPQKGLVFYAANLPLLPPSQTYQLWLVPMAGSPVSAGVFQADAQGNGAILLPPLPPALVAKAFAVTVEPAGGVPQPTGPKVLVGLVS